MLDVYRKYYGLTGEPFRLGPDHRFSLHHESYANAKAYLEYAIYQGEGFIAITGEPGTGKTTLISEILAGLDREKVQVATLTSTQLESRDLIYMVASSFDLHPEDASKANLLVEIESFLVRKIRNGQRAILIVDEAQGLSAGALEELRLLANLQYQYQLLLQIFLVGQESLLALIRAPGMEHLHQRLVAATSLEPLSFDETIDYIEHRLSKVGWSGDPAIDEGALREVYRYSGGIPRRINLIANRLFLYGGMEKKRRFKADDSRNVIQGLVEEFLLASEPLIADADVAAAPGSGGEARSRSLPRNGRASTQAPLPPKTGESRKAEAAPAPADKGQDASASSPAARSSEPVRKEAATPSPGNRPPPPPRDKSGIDAEPGSVAPKSPPPPAPAVKKSAADKMERPVPPKPAPGSSHKPNKKSGGKGIAIVVFLLASAGAAYLLREQTGDLGQVYKSVGRAIEPTPWMPPAPELKTEKEAEPATDGVPAENSRTGIVVKSVSESGLGGQRVPKTADRGEIVREQSPEPVDIVVEPKTEPIETPPAEAKEAAPVIQAAPPVSTPLVEADSPKPVQAQVPPVSTGQIDKPRGPEKITQAEPVKKRSGDVEPTLPVPTGRTDKPEGADKIVQSATTKKRRDKIESAVPVKTVERLAVADTAVAKLDTAVTKPETTRVEAQRSRLRAGAEQRFSARQARVQEKAAPFTTKPENPPDAVPAKETTPSAALSKSPSVKKNRASHPMR